VSNSGGGEGASLKSCILSVQPCRPCGQHYKAKVVNIEPGIQAAFVDFGAGKNGFLHISDLHPRYFSKTKEEDVETIGRDSRSRSSADSAVPQTWAGTDRSVTKEGIKTKGPTLTTYLLRLAGKVSCDDAVDESAGCLTQDRG